MNNKVKAVLFSALVTTMILPFSGGSKTGTNSVILSGAEYVNGVTCGSSHCGIYGLNAVAEDTTFET